MARLLITGGLGYLGGRVADHLARHTAHTVRLSSRRAAAAWPEWAREFEVVTAGLDGDLGPVLDGMDAVVHLAALNAGACAADPMAAIDVNVGGTLRLIAAAAKAGVSHVVYISTAHVYGAPLVGRLDETMPSRPRHPYAWTHRAAEDIVLASDGVAGTVLRLSNAVGAPMDGGADCWMLVANDLCRMAAGGGPLVLRGDGSEARNFIPIADAATAIDHALSDPSRFAGGLYNLGGDATTTIGQLAERIAGLAATDGGQRPEIAYGTSAAMPNNGSLDFRVDKLRAAGFSPAGNMDAALVETLHFCRQHFADPAA